MNERSGWMMDDAESPRMVDVRGGIDLAIEIIEEARLDYMDRKDFNSAALLAWDAYWAVTAPGGAYEIQRTETKKSFYAGAHAMLSIMKHLPDFMGDEEGSRFLFTLQRELHDFAGLVRDGGNI